MFDISVPVFSVRLIVHSGVLVQLRKYRQLQHSDREACGVLIGRIYPGIIEVTQFTAPQPTDTRRYASYTRRRAGHVDIATRIWEQSGGLEGYVGEWHTHPESIPKPSQRDLTETKKIARANGDTVVALILGQDHGCIFFADPQKVSAPIIFPLAEFSGHENA